MATYTTLSTETIRELLQNYDLGELQNSEILEGGQANSSCTIKTENGKYVLSVCDDKNEQEITLLTSTLDHLNNHGFRTSRLVKTTDGRGYISYQGKPVYVKEYIDGTVEESLSAEMFEQIGQGLAKLHKVPVFPQLPDVFSYGIQSFSEAMDREGEYPSWLREKAEQLARGINDELPRGFVHGDLFYDNILFDRGKLAAILDFEEACHYFLVFDIGMCIAGSCSQQNNFSIESAASLVKGYQSVRPLEKLEKEVLQLHIMYGAIATSFWRYRQFNITYPNVGKTETYKIMVKLAKQVENIPTIDFYQTMFGRG